MEQAVADDSVPPDRTYALLEVVCHAVLWARNLGSKITPRQHFDLMDAVHNIPIYLQHGGDSFWDVIQLSIISYDEQYQFPKLQSAFDRGMQQYAEQCRL